MKAVIFDLWDTLVEWPVDEAETLKRRLAADAAVDEEEFERRWLSGYRASQTGPLAASYRALGVPETLVAGHVVYEASHDEKLRTPRSESPRAARAAARR